MTLSSLILVERSLDVDSGRPYIITLSLHRSRTVNFCRTSEIWVEEAVGGFDVFDSRARTLDSSITTLVRSSEIWSARESNREVRALILVLSSVPKDLWPANNLS